MTNKVFFFFFFSTMQAKSPGQLIMHQIWPKWDMKTSPGTVASFPTRATTKKSYLKKLKKTVNFDALFSQIC